MINKQNKINKIKNPSDQQKKTKLHEGTNDWLPRDAIPDPTYILSC